MLRTLEATRSCIWMICACIVFLSAANASADEQEMYLGTENDPSGRLWIVTTEGREIIPDKEEDQVGFDNAAISADRRSVGWLALFPNCCASYPIPLKLVVYVNCRRHAFTGNELPIWKWAFSKDGEMVAFRQEPVHGGFAVHYELREILTGRMVAEYDSYADKSGKAPTWVQALDATIPSGAAMLTRSQLEDATYHSKYSESGEVRLLDGKAEVNDPEDKVTVVLTDFVAFGDLNGDDKNDAVAILTTSMGGTGLFYELAAIIGREESPIHVASAALGDRVIIESVAIVGQGVKVSMVAHMPDDPLCCPTLRTTKTFHLMGPKLVEEPATQSK